MAPAIRLECAGRLENGGAPSDGLQTDHRIATPVLVGIIGSSSEPLEAVVDDREPKFERLDIGEELRAIYVFYRDAGRAKLPVHPCIEWRVRAHVGAPC